MRSVVYESPGVVHVREFERPHVGTRDVLIRVEACGVCGSDLASFADGHYIEVGQVMGHEIAGRVEATGDAHSALPHGTRVTVRPMRSCGTCSYCADGNSHLCDRTLGPSLGYGTPGGFSDLVLVSEAVLGEDVFVADEGVQALDLLWAEPLAVALHAVGQIGRPAPRVIVVGAGAVGLTLVAAAVSGGAEVSVVEPLPHRRDAAAQLGATAYAPGQLPSDARFDAALDASGVPAAVGSAVPNLRAGAPIVLVGLSDSPIAYPTGGHPVVGAFAYRQSDFVRAVELINSGDVRLGPFVSHQYPLDEAMVALRGPEPGQNIVKVAIAPREGIS